MKRPASTKPKLSASCRKSTKSSGLSSGPIPGAVSTTGRPWDSAATPQLRLGIMAGAIDWVLTVQQQDAAQAITDEGKKRARRRYADAVAALSRAFALASASDTARAIRDEIGFFQAIRAALAKSTPGKDGRSPVERELAIQQIVSRAVVSTRSSTS